MRKSQSQLLLGTDSTGLPPPPPVVAPVPPPQPMMSAATAAAVMDPGTYPSLEPGGGNSQRLLVVANRLPVCPYKDKDGSWQFEVLVCRCLPY